MRFAVLKAGTASRATRERLGDFDALFTELLALPGQQWDVHDVEHGAFPADISAYNGLVITGSVASAYDDEPWVRQLLDATRAAHAAGVPILGICFGLQIVALALGGAVGPNPEGWDLGVVDVQWGEAAAQQAALAAAPEPLRILQTHQDIATELPPGAVLLGSSRRTRHEIFTLGEHVLCLQGHPEMDAEMVRELLEKRSARGLLDPERAREGLASLSAAPHREFLQRWLRAFLREGRLPAAA